MHHFIFPTKDTYVSELTASQNYGSDEILELRKDYSTYALKGVTRVFVQFNLSSLSGSLTSGEIADPKYFLRLYETEASDLSGKYNLEAYALSQSWEEGTGKHFQDPAKTDGASWSHRDYSNTNLSWSLSAESNNSSGSTTAGQFGGGVYLTGSGYRASQSFSYESPDIEMNVTDIVNNWLGSSTKISNNGLVLRFSGSQETDSTTRGGLKFFSSNTHTIYSPRLEVRWDDHVACSGSNTGSLLPLSMSGLVDNIVHMKNLRDSYRESEKVKFRIAPRKRYIDKTFHRTAQTITGSYIAEGSGSYSIVDIGTGEAVIPFSPYTSMSCDQTSNYFNQWMSGLYPNRMYKIQLKLNYGDGQEIIHDDGFEFKVRS